jgi:hypothetical protein
VQKPPAKLRRAGGLLQGIQKINRLMMAEIEQADVVFSDWHGQEEP